VNITASSKADKLKITIKLANIAIAKFEVRLYAKIAVRLLNNESMIKLKILATFR